MFKTMLEVSRRRRNTITVIDEIMGGGKTRWAIQDLLNKNLADNILYITPYLDECERIRRSATNRNIILPQNRGEGKIGNLAKLLSSQADIASTHELFRRFNQDCKDALRDSEYTLIIDEAIDAVEQYDFERKDDCKYLLENRDISIDNEGLIHWTGRDLDTRFNDVRTLSENKCLFRVDEKFYLWTFPAEVFSLFKDIYVLTYMFDGSLMEPYFMLNDIQYETKSIAQVDDEYILTDFHEANKDQFRQRLNIYDGELNENVSQKHAMLSATWSRSSANAQELTRIRKNFYNYSRNIIGASSDDIMWTAYKSAQNKLRGKGYSRGFIPCNCRATNDWKDKHCLMYGVNRYTKPGINKFFQQHGITVDQDKYALSEFLQWIWRSNIRIPDSDEIINLYVPARRMRELLIHWLYS